MRRDDPLLPDIKTLTDGLSSVFSNNGNSGRQLIVLEREPNEYASRAPSEIVKCRLVDGTEHTLLCKYENPDKETWSDVPYEAEVYRRVVNPCGLSTANFYGSHIDSVTGRTWIILEYLDKGVVLNEIMDSETLGLAARWLGTFHATQQTRLHSDGLAFLNVYDADYYLNWMRRAVDYSLDAPGEFEWLSPLCGRFEEFARPLLEQRTVVTHGDYYLHNILCDDERIYPLDWEQAGIDLGEIDLACLTDGWEGETARLCELEYQRARWPNGAPVDFDQTLGVARLCLYFYNLGTEPQWTTDSQGLWYSSQIRAVSEQLSLM